MMKLTVILLAALMSTGIFAQQQAQKFGIKSGYIKYELTGNTTGTKTIYWDNYGNYSRTEIESKTVTKMFGITSEEEAHTVSIIVKNKYWSADLLEETGQKGTLPYYDESLEMAQSMTPKEQEEFANSILESMGGQKSGTAKILGYTCDLIEVMGTKSWIYKGIILKSEASLLGIVSNELATEFKPGSIVSASQFKPLASISYEDNDARQQAAYGKSGNPFAAMAMTMEDGDIDEEDTGDDQIVPLQYPVDKFLTEVNKLTASGYKKLGNDTSEEQYIAMFLKGFSQSISVVATSSKNTDKAEKTRYESFSHNGKKCFYGTLEEGEGTALIVEYPAYDMNIIIASTPQHMSKQSLLDINDKLSF